MARMPRRTIEDLVEVDQDPFDVADDHIAEPEQAPPPAEAPAPVVVRGKRRMKNAGIAKIGYKGIVWGPGEICCVPTECTDEEVKALERQGLIPV